MCSRRFAVATAGVVIGCAAAHVQTFSYVVTEPGLGRFDYVFAVADLDGDGRDDVVARGGEESGDAATPAQRSARDTLRVFVSVHIRPAGISNFSTAGSSPCAAAACRSVPPSGSR